MLERAPLLANETTERQLFEAERRELEAKQRAFDLDRKCFELEKEAMRLRARVEELERGLDSDDSWPTTPQQLADCIVRSAPFLEANGVSVSIRWMSNLAPRDAVVKICAVADLVVTAPQEAQADG